MRTKIKRDEHYVLDLCDEILGVAGIRQHTFEELRGDPYRGRAGRRLPVDAYYPSQNLVVEYRERQHTQAVPFFDHPDRLTISGVNRRKQREIYDQRRRDFLTAQSINLIEIPFSVLAHDARGRLLRDEAGDREALTRLFQERK